jgi:quinol monooxygenase YgiN
MKRITIIAITFISFISFYSFTKKDKKMNTEKVSVLLRFKAAKGKKQELVNHLTKTAKLLTTNEEGTEIFTISTTPIDEEAVYVYEVYSNKEAKEIHETGEAYNKARALTNELVDGPPQVIPLFPQGGKGLK